MADPHAIVANWRITLNYTVESLAHKQRLYVKHAAPYGGSFYIQSRVSAGDDLPVENVLDDYTDTLAAMMGSTFLMGACIVEERVGTVYIPRFSYTPTTTPSALVFADWAKEATVTFYDTNMNRFKITVMEPHVPSPAHGRSYSAADANFKAWIQTFQGTPAGSYQPTYWLVSKYGKYINQTGFISYSVTYNKKLRRARALL